MPPALQLHVSSSAAGPSPLPGKERCFCPRSVTGFTVTSPFCNAHGRVFYSDPGSKEGSCSMPCVFCGSCSHFGTGCQLGIPRGSNPALAARLLNCMVSPPPKTTLLLHGVAVSPSTFGTWLFPSSAVCRIRCHSFPLSSDKHLPGQWFLLCPLGWWPLKPELVFIYVLACCFQLAPCKLCQAPPARACAALDASAFW